MASSRVPIVVVLGATGAGKSKLALEIAQKFGGEIISADAMQMYKGLDIVTNKVSPAERKLAKHHMIDFLDPLLQSTVVDFRNQALPLMDEMRGIGKMPVICGGTNYYIESLLWDVLVKTKDGHTVEPIAAKRAKYDNEGLDNLQLYEKLKEIDPERASELHPNERRKIRRSLEVFEEVGKKHSQILEEQRQNGGLLGGGLRYPMDQLVIFWVQCEQKTLDQRCDKRVDQMIAEGLLGEMQVFHEEYNKKRVEGAAADEENNSADYTLGIFQSIGFKEFHNYLKLDTEEQKGPLGQKFFEEGKEQMMLATRQYARKQVKWINQRFLRSGLDRQCPPVYGVSSDQPSKWEETVRKPAFQVVEAYVNGTEVFGHQPLPCTTSAHSFEASRQTFNCQQCNVILKGRIQFEAHLSSGRHKKMMASLRKKRKGTQHPITVKLRLSMEQQEPEQPLLSSSPAIDENHEKKASRIQLLSILREVTGLPLQNIKTALLRGGEGSNENTIELHFPVPPSFDISPSENDVYTKSVKERFSKVQHVKVLAVDIEKDDQQ